jgi:transcriptional regulator with GAF, ATPase, and Fis domain/serine/threonine protein kinase
MGRYVIDRIFAEGAQGRLYRAQDKITGQTCILKTGESVKKEALLALELNHPYIARPFDFGRDPQIGLYAAYPEYLELSLLEWKEKKAQKDDLRRVALQIAEVLSFLHHRGWLYNDFKPGHFLVSDQGIHVLDLGLCSRIDDSTSTFSGTFPYIAPERIAGRRCDARADIFALGMMLLHTLLPDEEWDYEPSIAVLQELSKRAEELPAFWKELLSEMTSLEASQRIESSQELWRRLLPSRQGNFLLFPLPFYLSFPENDFRKERVLVVQSASNANLRQVETQAYLSCWNNGTPTKSYDFRSIGLEDSFYSLHNSHCGEPSSDFISVVGSLLNVKLGNEELICFHAPEALASDQRALFSYGLSTLVQNKSFRFLITTTKSFSDLPDDSYKKISLPLLTRQNLDEIVPDILPSNGGSVEKIGKYRSKSYSVPEQLIADFRRELPPDQFTIWPAAAKESFLPSTLETVRPIEMRALGCFALSGGSITKSTLGSALEVSEKQITELLDGLESRGYVQLQIGNKYFLTLSPKTVLDRIRRDRTRQIAQSLLRTRTEGEEDQQALYKIACYGREKRLAAFIAVRLARQHFRENRLDAAMDWYWKAFICGADLQKSLLYKMARLLLRRVEKLRILRLMKHIRKRFGRSYSLLELSLDLCHRTSNYKEGIRKSKLASDLANKKGSRFAYCHFLVRYAGFLILNFQLDEGEKILLEIVESKNTIASSPRISGLINHFLGLLDIYRGKFAEALVESKFAAKKPHPYRITSVMNTGVTLIRLGRLNEAKRWIEKAITLFSRENDVDRLSWAYTNLGIVLKQKGNVREARYSYFHALQLSRICRNFRLRLNILSNLAITYSLEGRTNQAIRYHTRAALFAKKLGFNVQLGVALIDAAVQYSILGKYKSAVSRLLKALDIVSPLGLQFEIASGYENMGITYLLSHHYRKAVSNLELAINYFEKAGSHRDKKRAQIYLALALAEGGSNEKIDEMSITTSNPEPDSFEDGLLNYTLAFFHLHQKNFDKNLCRELIHQSEGNFRRVPSLFWLGKLQRLKADYLMRSDHFEKANISLQSAYNIFSRLGAKKELMNLSKGSAVTKMPEDFLNRMAERLPYKILLMIKEVLAEPDPDKMISKILSASLEFTDMERAVLILNDDPPRIFKSASLEEAAIKEIYDISNSAMDEATDSRKPYVRLDAVSDPYLKSKPSILASRIMSIVCLPLRANDKPLGVLYLDSREGVETLASTETMLLEIFAAIISLALNKSLILEKSLAENEDLRASLGLLQFPEIIGTSEPMMKVLKTVNQLLGTELPVLITGETGTGKEMIARVLHFSGKRKNGEFLAVNCSAISKSLLESELFGHEKGSFTGAMAQKKGLFEQARGGTLFLDEIGEMPYSMQAKLLRVLQEGEFRRVGGNETLHSDVRLVLATNRNLQEMVKQERFRQDLFYRIKGAQVHLPALRERSQDIPLLISHFVESASKSTGRKIEGFSPEALELMKNYAWPGNIRQLKNEVERVVALAQTDWIRPEDLDEEIRQSSKTELPQKGTLREKERQIIVDSLEENKWNIVQTAKTLGLTRNGLYGKMKLHGIPRKSVE